MLCKRRPLFSLCAGELMSANVVAISEEMSLAAAGRVMARAGINGAPVVDSRGKLVGVFSATDYMNCAARPSPSANDSKEIHSPWQMACDEKSTSVVRDFMTKDVVTVPRETSIGELSRMMLDAHIHRVVVVDATGKPVGVVSSTDILAAVVRADQQHQMQEEQLVHA